IRRVRAAERRAREAENLAHLGAMTSGLAHEIKNPLSTIGMNAQLLAEGIDEAGLPEDARGRLARRAGSLRREVDRLRGILTDFLQFAGELRLTTTPADLNDVVGELADFFLPQAEHHGVRLRVETGAEPVRALVDVPLIKQAALNLMLNAVQAMAGGEAQGQGKRSAGDLILRCERGRDPEAAAVVRLHVIDTGPGIPPDIYSRVFQPYFTTKSGGTGLGLPTTRRLVEAHGGRLDVYTQPGKGTDFTIVLPAWEGPSHGVRSGSRSDAARASGLPGGGDA
ncbi:MAG TPA: ATP-binding protein, partial [Phycisphaerales bacterium]|nr:ATP-binding protein [Phycisphaerales bacterium]